MDNTFIIAEIGINHNGDLKIAKELIQTAKTCGCNAVKFQKRTINIVYSNEELNSLRDSPWGTTFEQQKNGLEFGKKEYDEIDSFCDELNIDWFASAWDVKSLEFLDQYELKYNKIASAMITHEKFLIEVAKKKKYTFISTGMSNYKIIDKAVEIFKSYDCPFELMHSVSLYPCPENLLNLHLIQKLSKKYNCKVGYSGHESTVSPSVLAVCLGATSLERHLTLDRTMYGSDQAASLEKRGLQELVTVVRKLPHAYGSKDKDFFEGENKIAQKLRYWEREKK